ncbi:hypothetical protein [Novosphingobium gossypii]|uniref:hypothetical protein n=1 Tax=Novosphingobium gossypii TaxID=1604774 RepID=UPI003D1ED076
MNNTPDWRVTLDGQDLSDRIRPRPVSLTLSEKRGDEANQLDIVLSDHDGMLGIPPEGAVLHLQLGWKQGRDVTLGLIEGQLQGGRRQPFRPARSDHHPRPRHRLHQRDPQPPVSYACNGQLTTARRSASASAKPKSPLSCPSAHP